MTDGQSEPDKWSCRPEGDRIVSTSQLAKHEWVQAPFPYVSWPECTCGFRPIGEVEIHAHEKATR